MAFSFFGKYDKKDDSSMVSKEEYYEALGQYAASQMSFGAIESEPIIPEYQGDYAKAIFLWANAKRCPIKDNSEYARYILYECGIQNANEFHKKMIEDGYLEKDSFEDALESLKLDELKVIASQLGVAVSGKKADIAKRIARSDDALHLKREIPTTYSLTDKGTAFVLKNDDCIQIHRHKTWMIHWDEYSEKKKIDVDGSFYSICSRILLERASKDTRLFGRLEYLSLSQLEDEFGDPRRSIRYLMQVLYIDVSGVMGMDSYDFYRQGIYNKQSLKDMYITNIPMAPGVIKQIQKYKEHYESEIIDKLYSWKLPVMICEQQLYEEIINSVMDESFNHQYYSAQLKVRYERYVDSL